MVKFCLARSSVSFVSRKFSWNLRIFCPSHTALKADNFLVFRLRDRNFGSSSLTRALRGSKPSEHWSNAALLADKARLSSCACSTSWRISSTTWCIMFKSLLMIRIPFGDSWMEFQKLQNFLMFSASWMAREMTAKAPEAPRPWCQLQWYDQKWCSWIDGGWIYVLKGEDSWSKESGKMRL